MLRQGSVATGQGRGLGRPVPPGRCSPRHREPGSSLPQVGTEKASRGFLGIDIGSQPLDLAASAPSPALPRRVPNTAAGIARLLAALLLAELPVSVVSPAQISAFRQSLLGRHKTERVVAWLADDLAQVEARLAQVEREIATVLASRPETTALTAQIGVGPLTAAAVLA